MKILAFDIGIKNLSYCFLDCFLKKRSENSLGIKISNISKKDSSNFHKSEAHVSKESKFNVNEFKILDWDIINLYPENIQKKCQCLNKKKQKCNKKAKYYLNDNYFCKIHKTNKSKEIKKTKNNKNKNVLEYVKRIKLSLDKKKDFNNVDIILIENQPVNMNPLMKTIQIIVFSYFAFKGKNVKNVNARRKEKLPLFDESWENSELQKEYQIRIRNIKSKYSKRKFLCYYYGKHLLLNKPEMIEYLETNKKKDDLTDSFLMCIDYINNGKS